MRVLQSSWSIEVADEWTVTDHPECLTLELSDGGALQLSSARKDGGSVNDADLFEFAEASSERKEWGACIRTSCGEFDGIKFEYGHEGFVWRRWFLRRDRTILFATYNGSPSVAKSEGADVQRLLDSLRFEPSDDSD